ncbi:hypothetical protein [Maioricimonas rarisocia]|uniref:hypothetical protein n=1 Tax=Maioricimonas rarisocia TaxID=2528026 RepID=UPI0011A419F5|nr:hypothetical protein [Maioricimonas rarisocia]
MHRVFIVTVVVAAVGLALALWPGWLEIVLLDLPFVCAALPVIAVWLLLVMGLAMHELLTLASRSGWLWGLCSVAVLGVMVMILWLRVPQRAGLAMCLGQLRPLTVDAPVNESGGTRSDVRLGPYRVDRYGGDARGGVFFRTADGPDGLGPDRMSYGFAFRPNGEGSPFGNAAYRQQQLTDEWYTFAASNDW